jgi:hypothetical protein
MCYVMCGIYEVFLIEWKCLWMNTANGPLSAVRLYGVGDSENGTNESLSDPGCLLQHVWTHPEMEAATLNMVQYSSLYTTLSSDSDEWTIAIDEWLTLTKTTIAIDEWLEVCRPQMWSIMCMYYEVKYVCMWSYVYEKYVMYAKIKPRTHSALLILVCISDWLQVMEDRFGGKDRGYHWREDWHMYSS